MRVLHTSDWHLGHALHDLPRELEHRRFLDWLIDTLEAERVDALLVAGDVFDSANPPAAAQALWYRALAEMRDRLPALDVVVIGGNHDSAARLDAPGPLLRSLRIRVVGGLPRTCDGQLDVERLLVPLHDAAGGIAAWAVAVPFLRPADLPREADGPTGDPLIEGVRAVYARAIEAARQRREPGQAIVALGHCYMVGTSLSHLSERRVLGGNQHALPADLFPDDVAYVALGHLHKAQRVGRDTVRYAGSPIPLAMSEGRYRHQVCLVDVEDGRVTDLRSLPVPRAVDVVRVPARGAVSLDGLDEALAGLPDFDPERADTRPYLEVCVALERPEPRLRQRVERALEDKHPRLVKIAVEYTGDGLALGDAAAAPALRELDPDEVFLRRWRRDHHDDPPPELMEAFFELLDRVRQEGAG